MWACVGEVYGGLDSFGVVAVFAFGWFGAVGAGCEGSVFVLGYFGVVAV